LQKSSPALGKPRIDVDSRKVYSKEKYRIVSSVNPVTMYGIIRGTPLGIVAGISDDFGILLEKTIY
jgi:hypothetical protein